MSGKPTIRDYVRAYRDAQVLEIIWHSSKDDPGMSEYEDTFQRSIQRAKDEAAQIRDAL
ncbi:MAG TPA: hypothetical protein VIG71_02330 [Enteractinococcus sp.]